MNAVSTLERFSPGAPFWRVNREWLVSLGGARAVLLELAHPLIAAGVASHSRYRRDPFGRLFRTLWTMSTLTFGDERAALRAARQLHNRHRPVRGVLSEPAGPFPAGTEYAADDPFLKLWVLATLIDSILRVYELMVAALSPAEKEDYYADTLRLAPWLGLSPALMPPTYADFSAYMDAMLASDLLSVGPTARDIVTALYTAPVFGPLAWRASFVSVGLLPDRVREAFGFAWTVDEARRLERLATWSQRLRPWAPDLLLVHPSALWVEWAGSRHAFVARSHSGA